MVFHNNVVREGSMTSMRLNLIELVDITPSTPSEDVVRGSVQSNLFDNIPVKM